MKTHVLTGLDGRNPLGLFAAIGLLRVLDDGAARRGVSAPRIAFATPGDATPSIETDLELDEIVATVLEDARVQGDNAALQLAYSEEGELVPGGTKGAVRDLKPLPAAAAKFLATSARARRRVSGLAAAWFSELVQDRTKGNTKPTAFHFTAGNQTFLEMVEVLRTSIKEEDVREALIGPWRNASRLPSLSWDSSVVRVYALRARDPSEEKRGSVPAANWLGVLALEAFPVTPGKRDLITNGVHGGWKESVFRWPLWEPALTFRAVCSLLRVPAGSWTVEQRRALGITEVLASSILRSDQGGYGSFTPARLELPRGR